MHGTGTTDSSTGVRGHARNGTGVDGEDLNLGTGVYGKSQRGTGVRGFSVHHIGVSAQGGFYGIHATGGLYAGYFNGSIRVEGQIVTPDLGLAVVPHPDGSHRQLYGLACPEPRLEDHGEGQLTGGQTEVAIDPDFAALLGDGVYQVFLTPYGDCRGLYVSERGARSFVVRELQGGTSYAQFGYRLVAKPREAPARLKRVELPEAPTIQEPPEAPELPELPVLPPFQPERIQPPTLPPLPSKSG